MNDQLKEKPSFAQEFSIHKQLFSIITDKGLIDIKEKINTIHNEKIKTNKKLKQWGTATLSIVIIAVLSFYVKNKNIESSNPTIKEEIKKNQILS